MRLVKLEERQSELKAKARRTAKDNLELGKLEKEILPLKTFLDDAASHRKAIKAEISMFDALNVFYVHMYNFNHISDFLGNLENDTTTCVIVVDFTKFTIVTEGSVSCFVVALISHDDEMVAKDGMFESLIIILVSYCPIIIIVVHLVFAKAVEEWKPRIDYYDYYAQCADEKPIRQTFPFVKVCFHSISLQCFFRLIIRLLF